MHVCYIYSPRLTIVCDDYCPLFTETICDLLFVLIVLSLAKEGKVRTFRSNAFLSFLLMCILLSHQIIRSRGTGFQNRLRAKIVTEGEKGTKQKYTHIIIITAILKLSRRRPYLPDFQRTNLSLSPRILHGDRSRTKYQSLNRRGSRRWLRPR